MDFSFIYLFICICELFRSGTKVKSNAELCHDIREFVTSVGLPEDHVPSLKELTQHGRFSNLYFIILASKLVLSSIDFLELHWLG